MSRVGCVVGLGQLLVPVKINQTYGTSGAGKAVLREYGGFGSVSMPTSYPVYTAPTYTAKTICLSTPATEIVTTGSRVGFKFPASSTLLAAVTGLQSNSPLALVITDGSNYETVAAVVSGVWSQVNAPGKLVTQTLNGSLYCSYASDYVIVYPDSARQLVSVTDASKVSLRVYSTSIPVAVGCAASTAQTQFQTAGGQTIVTDFGRVIGGTPSTVMSVVPSYPTGEGFVAFAKLPRRHDLATYDPDHTAIGWSPSTQATRGITVDGLGNITIDGTAAVEAIACVIWQFDFYTDIDPADVVDGGSGYTAWINIETRWSNTATDVANCPTVGIGAVMGCPARVHHSASGNYPSTALPQIYNVGAMLQSAIPAQFGLDLLFWVGKIDDDGFPIPTTDKFSGYMHFDGIDIYERIEVNDSSVNVLVNGIGQLGSATSYNQQTACSAIATAAGLTLSRAAMREQDIGSAAWIEYVGPVAGSDYSTYAKEELARLCNEAWVYGSESATSATQAAPKIEQYEFPVLTPESVGDVVTEPQISYDAIGEEAQATAKFAHEDESAANPANGSGYYWSGWGDKDNFRLLSTGASTPVSCAICAGGAIVTVSDDERQVRVSGDDGATWSTVALPGTSVWVADGNNLITEYKGLLYVGNLASSYAWVSEDLGYTWTAVDALPAGFSWDTQLTATDGDGVTITAVSVTATEIVIGYTRAVSGGARALTDSVFIAISAGTYTITPRVTWDATHGQFLVTGRGSVLAIGDPTMLKLWAYCRNAYARTKSVNSKTYEWRGIHTPHDVIDQLLQPDWVMTTDELTGNPSPLTRIEWMTRSCRFFTCAAAYESVVDMLSLCCNQMIALPTQRLTAAGYTDLPLYGVITGLQNIDILHRTVSIEIMIP